MTEFGNYPGVSTETRDSIIAHLANIRGWARARNLIEGATPQSQFLKLVEEVGEFDAAGHVLDYEAELDGLGDACVVGTIIAAQIGIESTEWARLMLDCVRSDEIEEMFAGDFNHNFPARVVETKFEPSYRVIEPLAALAGALARGNKSASTGYLYHLLHSMIVCCRDNYSENYRFTLAEVLDNALDLAWNEIKDRKGVMYQGVFVKSTDERYEAACAELGVSP
jgi:hypothetical protein